jgi:hypothetical protein
VRGSLSSSLARGVAALGSSSSDLARGRRRAGARAPARHGGGGAREGTLGSRRAGAEEAGVPWPTPAAHGRAAQRRRKGPARPAVRRRGGVARGANRARDRRIEIPPVESRSRTVEFVSDWGNRNRGPRIELEQSQWVRGGGTFGRLQRSFGRQARSCSARWRAGRTCQLPSRGSLLHPQEKGPEGGIWVAS